MPVITLRPLSPPEGSWDKEQSTRLQRGMYSRSMDYRWCSYLIGHRLFLHCSWTGQGLFEAGFASTNSGWHVVAAHVESGHVNSYVDRPESELSHVLHRVINIAAIRLLAGQMDELVNGESTGYGPGLTTCDRTVWPTGLLDQLCDSARLYP